MLMSDYLQTIESNELIINNLKCKEHSKSYGWYCISCNQNLCALCKKNHTSHGKLIILKTNNFIKNFNDKLKEAKQLLIHTYHL